jgi:hypothetical protein
LPTFTPISNSTICQIQSFTPSTTWPVALQIFRFHR